jgi:hypothetical protein
MVTASAPPAFWWLLGISPLLLFAIDRMLAFTGLAAAATSAQLLLSAALLTIPVFLIYIPLAGENLDYIIRSPVSAILWLGPVLLSGKLALLPLGSGFDNSASDSVTKLLCLSYSLSWTFGVWREKRYCSTIRRYFRLCLMLCLLVLGAWYGRYWLTDVWCWILSSGVVGVVATIELLQMRVKHRAYMRFIFGRRPSPASEAGNEVKSPTSTSAGVV